MPSLLTNNAYSTLAGALTNVATSFSVAAGEGARFPNPGGGQYFYCTLSNAAGTTVEIVKCTTRATDAFTVVRGQDGTTGVAFSSGDLVELRPIAEMFREKLDALRGNWKTFYSDGSGLFTELALGGDGTVLRANGAAAAPTFDSPITVVTEQATTSGTSKDFTGIPATAKRITIMFIGVSTNGTSPIIVQLGDSGGFETTGYVSGAATGNSSQVQTTGLSINYASVAAILISGQYILSLQKASTFSWVGSGTMSNSTDGFTHSAAGRKATSAALDRIRITTVNGTDAFDAGSVSISYE